MSRIGILGGTFNPVHMGHLLLAECAREELQLDKVWLIPTGISYMKSDGKTAQIMPEAWERLEMTQLSVEGNPYLECMDIEVKRPGVTYSYETLEELKQIYPAEDFYFIVGADCLFAIEDWKCPERIFASCELAVAVRGNADISQMRKKADELQAKYNGCITLLPFRNLEISSTEIRERVKKSKSILYMTTENVKTYIEEKGFYRDEDSRS